MDDKERLEEIKELITESNNLSDKIADSNSYPMDWEDKIRDNLAYLFSECHIDWLIKQAERYEELRTKWNNQIDDKNEIIEERNELVSKVQRYKQALERIATRSMSMYLTKDDLTKDLYEIAWQGLEGDKVK